MPVYAVYVYHETWTCINLDLHSEEWHQSRKVMHMLCVYVMAVLSCVCSLCVCVLYGLELYD